MSDSLIGQTIDGYQIEEVIGRGGMGTVYRAVDVALDKTVALKIISPHLAEDETFLKRFRAEAKALARLDAPGVVRVLTLRETERGVFIVMEYVEGETLSTIVRRHAPISWTRALPLFRQILQAVHHAHASGVLHRDLKPSNILVTDDGQVKVTDFGLAKIQTSDANLTTTFETAGTIYYMSPEQIKGLRHVDERSDLFALGMIGYEVLTGRLPVDKTGSNYAIQHAIVEEPLPPPTDFVEDLPEALADWLMTMLAKDPSDRFQGATEALAALRDLVPTSDASADRPPAFSPPEPISSSTQQVAIIGGLVLAVLVLLGGAFWTVQYVLDLPTGSADAPPPTTLTVTTSPPGAAVFVDGDSVGQAPLAHPAAPDTVSVRARMPGFAAVDTTLAVFDDRQLSLSLVPLPLASNDSALDTPLLPTSEVSAPSSDPNAASDEPVAPPPGEASDASNAPKGSVSDAPGNDTSERSAPENSALESDTRGMRGTLTFTSTPDSATVVLNGTPLGVTPLSVDTLTGGAYQIAVRKAQRQAFTTTADVRPGRTTRVDATLAPQPAVLTLNIIPYGDILIDDSLRAESIEAAFVDTLSPGLHRVTARYRSMEWTKTLSLQPGRSQEQTIDFTRTVAIPITAQTEEGAPVPNAEIVVDGTRQGYTPQQVQLRIGQHTVTVRKNGLTPETRVLNVEGPLQEAIVFRLRPAN